jgi:penicillin amidase
VLTDFDLATRDVNLDAVLGKHAEGYDPERYFADAQEQADAIGSNNWVVAGSRTATGRPILANDPHREHSVPSLRYIVHLNAPGFSVIGAGEPSLPGISVGHNEQIAFGFTIFPIDQEDLYVYQLNPSDSDEYRYGSGWEKMRIVHERIEVKGEPAREVDLRFTRHGPVLAVDAGRKAAYAVRSVWFEPGTSAYFGSTDYMSAKDWNAFSRALARWGAPSENMVYADTSGNIGWIPAGMAPVRKNWDGLLPVPGDGRYEWAGFLRNGDLPRSFNPSQGWIATANQMNLPANYPIAQKKIGFEWTNPARYQRIAEVLAANNNLSLADAMALQNDDNSIVDRHLSTLLRPIQSSDPVVSNALALVRAWDGRVSEGSAAATVVEIWMSKHLGKAVVEKAAPEAARALIGQGSIAAVIDLLEAPDKSLGSNPIAARDAILRESFADAVREVTQLLGPDTTNWAWGKLHHAEFQHVLSPLADSATKAQMTVAPLQMGGSAYSPHAAAYRLTDFRITSGASFRMVIDVGNWDKSVAINTPGQSGNPFSPHYRDMAPLWAEGSYVPLLFSREAVERDASTLISLKPAE